MAEDLPSLLIAIAAGDRAAVQASLDAAPELVTARMARQDEFFLTECLAQVYEGDTGLHAAAFAYNHDTARDLVPRGAEIRARNRRSRRVGH